MEPVFRYLLIFWPLLLPSIMKCLLSKLEELLTNKYSGLISDQQNNKWRKWKNTLPPSQGKILNPRILTMTELYLKLSNVMKKPNHWHSAITNRESRDTFNQIVKYVLLGLYLVMLTGSHALGVQIQMQEGANCCNKLNILTFIMNSNNLLWYHFPWG